MKLEKVAWTNPAPYAQAKMSSEYAVFWYECIHLEQQFVRV